MPFPSSNCFRLMHRTLLLKNEMLVVCTSDILTKPLKVKLERPQPWLIFGAFSRPRAVPAACRLLAAPRRPNKSLFLGFPPAVFARPEAAHSAKCERPQFQRPGPADLTSEHSKRRVMTPYRPFQGKGDSKFSQYFA